MVLFRFIYIICSFPSLKFNLFIIDVLQDSDRTVTILKNINNEKIKLKARKATYNIHKSEQDHNPTVCSWWSCIRKCKVLALCLCTEEFLSWLCHNCTLVCPFIFIYTRSLTRLLVFLLAYSLTHLLTHSLIQSFSANRNVPVVS